MKKKDSLPEWFDAKLVQAAYESFQTRKRKLHSLQAPE